MLMQKGTGGDVVKLVTTYEDGVYGNTHFHSTNGYEQRRQAALAMGGGSRGSRHRHQHGLPGRQDHQERRRIEAPV